MLRLCRDNGRENGNYYGILGLYRDNGKEHGNYWKLLGVRRIPARKGILWENGRITGLRGISCTSKHVKLKQVRTKRGSLRGPFL